MNVWVREKLILHQKKVIYFRNVAYINLWERKTNDSIWRLLVFTGNLGSTDLNIEYKTQAGRIVFGGGGITPDIFVDNDDKVPRLAERFLEPV